MQFDLVGIHARNLRKKAKFTVLKRPGGTWSLLEVNLLINGLPAETQRNLDHPEVLALLGDFEKATLDELLKGKENFEHTVVTGYDNPELPFHIIG